MNKFTVKSQSGAVLIISLIMLLALTIIGITSSSVTGLEEKMAANAKDMNLAFQAAEAALREVEATVLKTRPAFDRTATDANQGISPKGVYTTLINCKPSPPAPANDPYVCDSDHTTYPRSADTVPPLVTTIEPFYANVDWEATSTPKYDTYVDVKDPNGQKLVGLYKPPAYIVEEVMSKPPASSCDSDSLEGGQTCQGSSLVDTWIRITAHGWGSTANSVATVQSVVKITYAQ